MKSLITISVLCLLAGCAITRDVKPIGDGFMVSAVGGAPADIPGAAVAKANAFCEGRKQRTVISRTEGIPFEGYYVYFSCENQ